MSNYTHRDILLLAALLILLIAAPASAQDNKLVDEDWYGDVKKALADHYTGKTVRVKAPIPATRRGLEMIDGAALREPSGIVPPVSARIGDELMIKSFRVGDSNVEVLLGKDEPQPKKKFPNPFAARRESRINLRFSHELSSKDLTIENLNRYLGQAIDVTKLASPINQDNSTIAGQNHQSGPKTIENPELSGAEPALKTVGELAAVGPDVGELTIDCSTPGARIYIDGSYSGLAPRTLRVRAGFHSILVVSDLHKTWEQRLLIPGAKISVVRVELQK